MSTGFYKYCAPAIFLPHFLFPRARSRPFFPAGDAHTLFREGIGCGIG